MRHVRTHAWSVRAQSHVMYMRGVHPVHAHARLLRTHGTRSRTRAHTSMRRAVCSHSHTGTEARAHSQVAHRSACVLVGHTHTSGFPASSFLSAEQNTVNGISHYKELGFLSLKQEPLIAMPQEPARLPPCLSHRHPGSGGCPRCWGPMRGWGPSVWLSRSSASERGFHRATVHEAHACPARLPPRPGAADRSVPAFPPRPSSARRGPGAAVPGVSRAVAPGTSRVPSAFGLAVTRCVLKRGRRKLFGKNTVQRERGACASARAPVRPSSHSATCRSVGASPLPLGVGAMLQPREPRCLERCSHVATWRLAPRPSGTISGPCSTRRRSGVLPRAVPVQPLASSPARAGTAGPRDHSSLLLKVTFLSRSQRADLFSLRSYQPRKNFFKNVFQDVSI